MSTILVLNGHPNPGSFTAILATTYTRAARAAGATVNHFDLHALTFDPVLHVGYRGTQELEPDLLEVQRALAECDHLVILAPVWWGSTPALLKGFFDRTLEPKWAYHYDERGLPHGHFGGRSARFIMSADSPGWYLRVLQGRPTLKQVVNSTLKFCGFGPVAVTRISPVRTSDAGKRDKWIDDVRAEGEKDVQKLNAGKKRQRQDPFQIRASLLSK